LAKYLKDLMIHHSIGQATLQALFEARHVRDFIITADLRSDPNHVSRQKEALN
jgi:hypothetical protein